MPTATEAQQRRVRIALYKEILRECDGPQLLLAGRRLTDITDWKEWLAVRLYLEEHNVPLQSLDGRAPVKP